MKLVVKERRIEAPQTVSLVFEKPSGFQFYPAQFIDVGVEIDDPDNSRIYSLSSSPTEDDLWITFREGISAHKKKLQTLGPGDEVSITHPNGTYTLDERSPAVMLAGGIGIAPYRSMIKFAVDQKLDTPLLLIYSNSDEKFAFKEDLDKWQKEYPKLTIHYIITSRDGRLTKDKLERIFHEPITNNHKQSLRPIGLEPIYYLAGPPSFVEDMERILAQLGVDRVNIRLDSFDGY